jgi:hypothetical protein
MDLKMILTVLGIAIFGFFGIWLLIPENIDDEIPRYPWLVERDQSGRTQVFGFTLGETTLGEIREFFREEGEINLFARLDTNGKPVGYAVETYFEQIYLNRLRADFVITLEADRTTLESMYERGLRISQLGSGAKKVKLDPADVEILLSVPIRSITYLPWKSLDAEIIQNRFGTPAEKRTEPETRVTHWLYPDKGMDVGIDPDGGVVVQYVNRDRFGEILAPLDELSREEPPDAPEGASGQTDNSSSIPAPAS